MLSPMDRYGRSMRGVVSMIGFLASEGGGYITGRSVRVDGGITRSV